MVSDLFFADLNNLKFANDNFGHIAGDEFVVISVNKIEKFNEKIANFAKDINSNNQIACFGFDIGDSLELDKTMRMAERRMYQEKEKYYKKTGINRRKG